MLPLLGAFGDGSVEGSRLPGETHRSIPKTKAADLFHQLASSGLHAEDILEPITSLHTKLEEHQALKFLSEQIFVSGKLSIKDEAARGTLDDRAEDLFVHLGPCEAVKVTEVKELLSKAECVALFNGGVFYFIFFVFFFFLGLFFSFSPVYCLASLVFWWRLWLFAFLGFSGFLASCASCVLSCFRAVLRAS